MAYVQYMFQNQYGIPTFVEEKYIGSKAYFLTEIFLPIHFFYNKVVEV
jgi:hypothetical protein